MFRTIVLTGACAATVLTGGVATAATPWKLGLGFGLEGQLAAQVNPELADWQARPQLYATLRRGRWGAVFNAGRSAARETSQGGLSVESRTSALGAWGRHFIAPERYWNPYVTAGAGLEFDEVETSFGSQTDTRLGRRALAGGGLGMDYFIWDRFVVEAEYRMTAVQDRVDPAHSVTLRLGFQQ